METKYDLIIIGSGSAAESAAFKCLANGWSVAVIDEKPIGGTCALRGCDPKKVLYGVTEAVQGVRRLKGKGIGNETPAVKWGDLMEFKKTFTEPMSKRIENSLTGSGARIFNRRARFLGENKLEAGDVEIEAGHFLIASGNKAARLEFDGSQYVIDNEGFLSIEVLPEKIVFIGGGYISVEFAGIAQKAGAQSTIIQRSGKILKNFDDDASDEVLESLRDQGIEVLLDCRMQKIEKAGGKFRIYTSNSDEPIVADLVVHGAGREFDPDMGLDRAGVEWTRHGVKVNQYLQSSTNPRVYAAGDAADTEGLKLTPIAGLEGSIAAENMLSGNSAAPFYKGTPTVVYTSPPLSMVGLTEKEAANSGLKYIVKKGNQSSWYNSRRRGIEHGFYKILLEEGTGRILGAHIFGENSEETINLFALAIRENIGAEKLLNIPYAYPSDTSDIRYMLQ